MGITSEFSSRDKLTVGMFFAWIFAWFSALNGMILLSAAGKIDLATWGIFWKIHLFGLFGLMIVTTVWLAVGGIRDIRTMFRLVDAAREDQTDDGTVDHKGGTPPESGNART